MAEMRRTLVTLPLMSYFYTPIMSRGVFSTRCQSTIFAQLILDEKASALRDEADELLALDVAMTTAVAASAGEKPTSQEEKGREHSATGT